MPFVGRCDFAVIVSRTLRDPLVENELGVSSLPLIGHLKCCSLLQYVELLHFVTGLQLNRSTVFSSCFNSNIFLLNSLTENFRAPTAARSRLFFLVPALDASVNIGADCNCLFLSAQIGFVGLIVAQFRHIKTCCCFPWRLTEPLFSVSYQFLSVFVLFLVLFLVPKVAVGSIGQTVMELTPQKHVMHYVQVN